MQRSVPLKKTKYAVFKGSFNMKRLFNKKLVK
jgi:hypothetical protein